MGEECGCVIANACLDGVCGFMLVFFFLLRLVLLLYLIWFRTCGVALTPRTHMHLTSNNKTHMVVACRFDFDLDLPYFLASLAQKSHAPAHDNTYRPSPRRLQSTIGRRPRQAMDSAGVPRTPVVAGLLSWFVVLLCVWVVVVVVVVVVGSGWSLLAVVG